MRGTWSLREPSLGRGREGISEQSKFRREDNVIYAAERVLMGYKGYNLKGKKPQSRRLTASLFINTHEIMKEKGNRASCGRRGDVEKRSCAQRGEIARVIWLVQSPLFFPLKDGGGGRGVTAWGPQAHFWVSMLSQYFTSIKFYGSVLGGPGSKGEYPLPMLVSLFFPYNNLPKQKGACN
eukprot:1156367-Pelagomonas_calceolata.AAC.2